MTAQHDLALVMYLLLAAAIASLVAVVVFALRARPRPRVAPTASGKPAELGFFGVVAVVAAAVVGAVLGSRFASPNDDC